MIGRRVESHSSLPGFGLTCGVVAAILGLVAAFTGEVNFAIAAVGPAVPAAILVARRGRHVAVEFTEDGLAYESGGETGEIPYVAIERVWAPNRPIDPNKPGKGSYPIAIGHAEGVLRLPARLDVRSDEIYRFLLKIVPLSGTRAVHPDLEDYLDEQCREFGDERVWSYHASPRPINIDYGRFRLGAIAIFLGGAAWIVAGVARADASAWAGAGACVCVMAAIFWLASFASSGAPRIKDWKEASLVVSPLGLALVQGKVAGEMTWDELRDVKLTDARSFRMSNQTTALGRGIFLKVEGATILVPDIYDRPIYTIYEAIQRYWQ